MAKNKSDSNKTAPDAHALMWIDKLIAGKDGFKLTISGGHGCFTPQEQAFLARFAGDDETKIQVDIRMNQPELK